MKIFKRMFNRFSVFLGEKTKETGLFSDFFLNASPEEKKKVFIQAAHKANEDQRKIFMQSNLKPKTN